MAWGCIWTVYSYRGVLLLQLHPEDKINQTFIFFRLNITQLAAFGVSQKPAMTSAFHTSSCQSLLKQANQIKINTARRKKTTVFWTEAYELFLLLSRNNSLGQKDVTGVYPRYLSLPEILLLGGRFWTKIISIGNLWIGYRHSNILFL